MMRTLTLLLLLTCSASAQEISLEGPTTPIPVSDRQTNRGWEFVDIHGITSEEMKLATVMVMPPNDIEFSVMLDLVNGDQQIKFRAFKPNKYKFSLGFNMEHIAWRESLAKTYRDANVAQLGKVDPKFFSLLKQLNTEAPVKWPSRSGSCIVEVVGKVVHPPPVDPVDPIDPVDPDVTPFEETIEKIAKETIDAGGSADTAFAISNVFSIVSAGVANGEIAVANAISAVNAGMKRVFTTRTDEAKWTSFRKDLSESLDFIRRDGSLQTKAQYVAVLQEVSDGVRKAAQSSN